MDEAHVYIAIDLKSFYASVECVERGLDPLTTNLVVADPERTEKTICLAVSPSLKAYGIPGRARLFEVVQKVKEVNAGHPKERLTYQIAPPRMALYMDYSTRIYNIYLRYAAPEDIHVYSIDEVFMDVTHLSGDIPHDQARELAAKMYRMSLLRRASRNRRDRNQSLSVQSGARYCGKTCKAGSEWCAHCKTGRDELPQTALELPSADGFLAVGRGYQKKLEEINQQIEEAEANKPMRWSRRTCWISRRTSSAARSPTPSSRSMRWRRSWRTTSRRRSPSTTCSAVRCG